MTKATGRLILLVAIVGLIVALFAVQFFLPFTGVNRPDRRSRPDRRADRGAFQHPRLLFRKGLNHERHEAHHPLHRREAE